MSLRREKHYSVPSSSQTWITSVLILSIKNPFPWLSGLHDFYHLPILVHNLPYSCFKVWELLKLDQCVTNRNERSCWYSSTYILIRSNEFKMSHSHNHLSTTWRYHISSPCYNQWRISFAADTTRINNENEDSDKEHTNTPFHFHKGL